MKIYFLIEQQFKPVLKILASWQKKIKQKIENSAF